MKKNLIYIGAGIAVLALVVIVFFGLRKPKTIIIDESARNSSENNTVTTNTEAKTLTQTAEKKPQTTTPTAPKPAVKLPAISKAAPQSYIEAAEKYKKSGYYLQFFPCQATPGSLIVKQGSKVMLDNRDSKAHSIGIKSDKYLIASYNYAIATLNHIGTNNVTCDGGGSAVITVVP